VRRAGVLRCIITATLITFTAQPVRAQGVQDEPAAEDEPTEPIDEPLAGSDEPEAGSDEPDGDDAPPPEEEDTPDEQEAEENEPAVEAADAEVDVETADAAPTEGDEPAPRTLPWLQFWGYFAPGFQFIYRPDAKPLDEWQYGFVGDASLGLDVKPFETWTGQLQLVFRPRGLEFVNQVGFIERADGSGGVASSTEIADGLAVERALVAYQPIRELGATLGVMRIPFTVQAQSANNSLMFPRRAPPNRVFVSGADIGGLVHADIEEGVVVASGGVFNGDSLGLQLANKKARGVVFAGRADINPFGAFPFTEGDRGGPFRLGFGGGILYRPASLFDERTGLSPLSITDLRFSGSLRMAYSGLYVVVEALRRQQTDDFSNRPEVANGAFAQASLFFRVVPSVGIEPILRAGFVVQDDAFDPRTVGSTAAGINFYPQADDAHPDRIKLTLAYLGERRFTEGESAHGGLSRVQLTF